MGAWTSGTLHSGTGSCYALPEPGARILKESNMTLTIKKKIQDLIRRFIFWKRDVDIKLDQKLKKYKRRKWQ